MEPQAIPDANAFEQVGTIKYYHDMPQSGDEWHQLRLGMITASTMKLFLAPKTLKIANNDKTRAAVYQMAADRITRHHENGFMSYAMERGHIEEVRARDLYSEMYTPVKECGFVVNNKLGFDVGFSPDGLVDADGGIEVKSRDNKYQVQTVIEHMVDADSAAHPIPIDYMLQVQTSLFISERKWWDFLSFSNGMNMGVIRCHPIAEYQNAIEAAAISTEKVVRQIVKQYEAFVGEKTAPIFPVEREEYHEEITA